MDKEKGKIQESVKSPPKDEVSVIMPNLDIIEQLIMAQKVMKPYEYHRYNKLLLHTIMRGTARRVDLNAYKKANNVIPHWMYNEERNHITFKCFLVIILLSAVFGTCACYLIPYLFNPNGSPVSILPNFPSVTFVKDYNSNYGIGNNLDGYLSLNNSEEFRKYLTAYDRVEAPVIDKDKEVIDIKEVPNTFIVSDNTIVYDNRYWGPQVEKAMPEGFDLASVDTWERYVEESVIVKMESGCGRMQNRLVTFQDGTQACVRYRQNTDQIQGEIFSFYLGKILQLRNLVPSAIKIVDFKDKLWANVSDGITAAQWNANRAVVLTQYVPSLESANIPNIFKPRNRRLSKFDVVNLIRRSEELKIAKDNNDYIDIKISNKTIRQLVELAQWSDLIVFDYLTANLDRIVNNLFNFQWNANIMDGPAHNLAKKADTGLLLFLDNESGLLHGYRLLKKYELYHRMMLDSLCVFRKSTISSIKELTNFETLSARLDDMYQTKNDAVTRDILPPMPEKNKKVLHDRVRTLFSQFTECKDS